ncbi:hypothetical protein ACFWJM_19190 [Streptomyces sp. NPDC127077]|uniref:hypothetical protein n=1 Tax=Streptomyces sp. NPDC127077 TaxID=3347131 RepID=UPI003648661C
MNDRTRVSLAVPADRYDEVHAVLQSLAPDVGPSRVNHPGSDGPIGVSAGFPGDVRKEVRARLDALGLECQVELGTLDEL